MERQGQQMVLDQDDVARTFTDDGTNEIPEVEQHLWMTREEVEAVCPPCAEKMKKMGIIRIRSQVIFNERISRVVLGGGCPGCPEEPNE